MAKHLYVCTVCGTYTMKEIHCSKKTHTPQPAKYSPEDKYGKYRRQAKKEQGLL
ncbi:MAG TPA: nucleolar RNA-binding Nop10p family protein [Candidatus Nanoarchaeia archaeon]|nr:nucleolar RNA-binding Nop10p family protein [Candidatus Nanoarchaeia archaeon]